MTALPRAAGILLHPTSLPGPNGIGELGDDALRFLDFLAESGMSIWQMLPMGPTGYGDSPYQSFSAFAGNPLMVAAPGTGASFHPHRVDFEAVIPYKQSLLASAFDDFAPDDSYRSFVVANAEWLQDYALFMALKDHHSGATWTAWEAGAAMRAPGAMEEWRTKLAIPVARVYVEQYLFRRQFHQLKQAARERGIRLMGDLPMYVAHDSADVWAHRDLFRLDGSGVPLVQAGVPPDYFSATGQLWGNPIYDWAALRAQGYRWWIRRIQAMFDLFDIVAMRPPRSMAVGRRDRVRNCSTPSPPRWDRSLSSRRTSA